MPFVNLGEWTPDNPQHTIATIHDLSNALPDMTAYTSAPSFKPITAPILEDGVPAVITGSQSFIDANGVTHTFAGTRKALYKLESTAVWADVSAEGGYNGFDTSWQFAMYGNYIIATNYNDPIQVYDLSSTSVTTRFTVMSETAPRCRTLAIVNEFLFLGDTVDVYDGPRPGRVWWSPIADPRGVWEPNQTTMCDYQDIGQGVNVVRVVGGESAKVFMRSAVVRGTFVGSPLVFQFDVIEPARGCVGLNALAVVGDTVYFLAHDGFYAISSGGSTAIGVGKVDQYILDRYEAASLALTQCAADVRHKTIWWAIYTEDASGGYYKTSMVFHYPSGRWGKLDMKFYSLHAMSTRGYTLDELDDIDKVLEFLPFPLDSIMYKGGVPVVGCFDVNGRLCYGYGQPMDAYIETGTAPYGEHETRTFIRRVRPVLDGDSKEHTMNIAGKQVIAGEDIFTADIKLTRLGDFACRKSGRYHKIRFNLKGDWQEMSGYTVTLDQEGTQ